MDLHLLNFMSYPLWTLVCSLFFPIIAAIATFVCLRRARTPKKMLGFFVIIPIFVALTTLVCADTGSLMSGILPELASYPVIGFLSALCLGVLCLNFTALIGGAGVLKRRGAMTNTIASFICLGINIYLTYSTWAFAYNTVRSAMARNDAGMIDIKDALPFTDSIVFLPDPLLDSGIEMLAIAVLAVYLIVYFLSFIALKTPEEIVKEDLERRRRAALMAGSERREKADRRALAGAEEEEEHNCCAFCEHATTLKGDRTKMVCDTRGVVSASHTCRKFLYDPLKRTAVRPKIDPLPNNDLGNIDHI